MKLVKYLANLGYGSRREVTALLDARRVRRADGRALREGDAVTHEEIRVDGEALDPPPGSVIMLHKPAGYTTSTTDAGAVIYDLLPLRFRRRDPLLAPVGRLDRDTTGLLLLTDDGALNHRLASPRTHLPKTYEVVLAEALRGDEGALFASGTLVLHGEDAPLVPATLEVLGETRARLVLTEGRYHQVKRMFGAVGNRVTALHRSAIGGVTLGDLAPGAWRVLDAADRAALTASAPPAP
ncbi:MAG: pseudouridine synthase [Gemmatimonadaceae bacterium]|nr:pseudouridine synthase [Gemmatimonadaceae bacterium]